MCYWMSSNRLKVNPTKTQFLWAATSRRQQLIPRPNCRRSQYYTILLYRTFQCLSLSGWISKTISSGYFYLRQIRSIHKCCLPTDADKSLINAFIISRLDYCNGLQRLRVNIPHIQLDRLQSVFNGAASLIFVMSHY